MINHLVIVAAVLLSGLGTRAIAESSADKPKSYEGVTAALKLEKTAQKADEPLNITITVTCTTEFHRLYNPFFNGLLPEPGRIVVRNSRGEVVNKLLERREGSMRTPHESDYFQVPDRSFIGGTMTVFPSRRWPVGYLPPGDYTLQLELDEIFLSSGRGGRGNVIITSEQLPYRIVE